MDVVDVEVGRKKSERKESLFVDERRGEELFLSEKRREGEETK